MSSYKLRQARQKEIISFLKFLKSRSKIKTSNLRDREKVNLQACKHKTERYLLFFDLRVSTRMWFKCYSISTLEQMVQHVLHTEKHEYVAAKMNEKVQQNLFCMVHRAKIQKFCEVNQIYFPMKVPGTF